MQGYDNLKKDSVYRIYIYSTSTNTRVTFPLFLTSFSDSFKSNWNSTSVYGKMDPIVNFKNTTRSISVGFDVPNESLGEAQVNMARLDNIIKGMYPVYVGEYGPGQGGSNVMASPPMYRVRMSNLICNASYIPDFDATSDNSLRSGLLGYIQDFTFNPDIGNGFFIDTETKNILPKLVKVSFTLNVIHEHPLGTENYKGELLPRINPSDNQYAYTFPHKYEMNVIEVKRNTPATSSAPTTVVGSSAATATSNYLRGSPNGRTPVN